MNKVRSSGESAKLLGLLPLNRDSRYGPLSALCRGVERAHYPVAELVHTFRHADGRHSRDACTVRGPMLVSLVTPTVVFRDTSAASSAAPHPPGSWCGALDHVGCHASRSIRQRICRKRLPVK